MSPISQSVRVIVRIPYNRPEDPLPEPPLVDWNPEKEHMLWEVIAKSRSIEGAATDWKGLAAHLQVPLPFLLHRAQTRYEEDLRGLQGIQRGTLSPAIPPLSANVANEYFPRLLELPRVSTSPAAHHRPLGVRARLNSLGQNQRLSPVSSPHPAKKVLSSSTLTLQGARKSRTPPRLLSPASSHAGSSDGGVGDYEDEEDEDEDEDEQTRKEEEDERQKALEKKLLDLGNALTKDKLGLVSSPVPVSASLSSVDRDRGRTRPLSASVSGSASLSSARSHQSLSSAGSMHGSIPSIPSLPSHTPPRQQSRAQLPQIARTLSPQGKSSSPPALSPTHVRALHRGSNGTGGGMMSEQGSEASSFSDLSDASLSASALESSLLSNIRSGGSRFSSFARSNLTGRRGGVR